MKEIKLDDRTYIDRGHEPAKMTYTIECPDGGWRRVFSDQDKEKLRPIAETLAMLDGNAFFGIGGTDFYESYLPEADAVYRSNGGDDGWASEASWVKTNRILKNDPVCKELWEKLQVMIKLKLNEKI